MPLASSPHTARILSTGGLATLCPLCPSLPLAFAYAIARKLSVGCLMVRYPSPLRPIPLVGGLATLCPSPLRTLSPGWLSHGALPLASSHHTYRSQHERWRSCDVLPLAFAHAIARNLSGGCLMARCPSALPPIHTARSLSLVCRSLLRGGTHPEHTLTGWHLKYLNRDLRTRRLTRQTCRA